jgi:recombination protein RecR
VTESNETTRTSCAPSGSAYPESVERLLSRLPGIGRRSAERLAFHVLKAPRDEAMALAKAISDVKTSVRYCPICFNFAEGETCSICADPRRDRSLVLVVEQPKDLIAIEQTGMYRGVYHVLLGRLAPLEGVGPEALTVDRLFERVDEPGSNSGRQRVEEVVLGLNPTLEGDGTALYLAEELERRPVRVSRLARGLASGRELEFASKASLAEAISGRRPLG